MQDLFASVSGVPKFLLPRFSIVENLSFVFLICSWLISLSNFCYIQGYQSNLFIWTIVLNFSFFSETEMFLLHRMKCNVS